MGDLQVRRQHQITRIGLEFLPNQREQARLAAAIAAGNAHLPAGVQGETGIADQQLGATTQSKMFETQHGGQFSNVCAFSIAPRGTEFSSVSRLAAIKPSQADRLADVPGLDLFDRLQVRNGARHLEDAVIGAHGETEPLHRLTQQLAA